MMKVVQCWDDGVTTDVRLVEILRKYGAKATFNLNPGNHGEKRREACWVPQPTPANIWSHQGYRSGKLAIGELPEIYKGFQVASHCWQHETAGTIPDDEWIIKAYDARKYLEDLFQRPCTGFAWPNGKVTQGAIDKLREKGFSYGRSTLTTYDVTDCEEPLALASNCHFLQRDFWTRYDKAKETGVFYFWGHSYEMMNYDEMWNYFEEKIKIITEDPDTEWADVIDIVPMLKCNKKTEENL
jgi:peptidoglycan/xylan/chitin deacetylase (PgdA/CDA1 family)